MVQPVDGYLLLSGGTDADIKTIVQGAQAKGARSPSLLLGGPNFKAFIPIDAASPIDFAQKVTSIVGGRAVNHETFTVFCPHTPPGVHICPIKRVAFNPAVHVLAFALVSVAGSVSAALTDIHGKGLTVSSIVDGSATAKIVVEVQESSLANVSLKFALLGTVQGIGVKRLAAKLPNSV